jgi:hypothetical protein
VERKTNPDVYPVTAEFEQQVQSRIRELPGRFQQPVAAVFQVMAENIGEYEHGSADVEDTIGNWTDDNQEAVQIYADVCFDVMLSWMAKLADPPQSNRTQEDA